MESLSSHQGSRKQTLWDKLKSLKEAPRHNHVKQSSCNVDIKILETTGTWDSSQGKL